MYFERGCSRRRTCGAERPCSSGRSAAALALGVAVGGFAAIFSPAARAAPLDEPFVGGLSFSGPTSGTIAAVYWNPAALGLMRGLQIMVAGSGRLVSTRVARAPIDPTTGAPGGTSVAGQASSSDLSQPIQWPIGPGEFMGISWDLGGDRFTLAFATYTPYVEQIHFPTSAAGDEPTRYHLLSADLRNLALVPALSIRFAGDLRIGFAPGFMFSTGRLAFAEDLALDGGSAGAGALCNGVPCGVENPAAAARLDIDSGHGLGDAKFSFTLGAGIYFKRRSFEIGLAYSSQPIGGDVTGVEVAGGRTTVTAPPRAGGGLLTCANGRQTAGCVFGDMSYRLPDTWTGGVTVRPRPGLEISGMARWIRFHVHDRIDIRLLGQNLDPAGIPQHIVLYRGFQDVWDTRVRVAYWWRERVRVGAALRLETSAVPATAATPGAVDGLKVQPILLAELQVTRHLWIGGGYGIAFQREVTARPSDFDPLQATACAMANGDVTVDACKRRLSGRARPTAEGTYRRAAQDFGLTVTARF